MSKEMRSQPHPEEVTIKTLDSPEERWTAWGLRITRRLEEIPVQELELGDILRTTGPDPDGQSGSRKEETGRLTTAAMLPGSGIP